MNILIGLTVIFNILAILILLVGLFYKFNNPKNKAVYGYSIAGCVIPYLFLISIISVIEIIAFQNFKFFIFIISVASPFVIGKFAKYESLKKYTFIQILCFTLFLVLLLAWI